MSAGRFEALSIRRMNLNPPAWLKKRVRIDFEGLTLEQDPVSIDVRRRGVAPFWRGWWVVEVLHGQPPDSGRVEMRICGGRRSNRGLDIGLPLTAARRSRRLFFADWPIRNVTLEPLPDGERLQLLQLRLAPMLRSHALAHMRGVLAGGSRDLHGRPLRSVPDPTGADPKGDSRDDEQQLYENYQQALRDQGEGESGLYKRWMRVTEPHLFHPPVVFTSDDPTVSVVMPVHNPPEAFLRRAIESVLGQSYGKWELCIADDASSEKHVRTIIGEYCRREERVKVAYLTRHAHISGATNHALALASGEFVAFLDHDDELSPHALNELVVLLRNQPRLDIIYSDEDHLDNDGNRCAPHFKSDWNPYLLYSHNYVTHLCVYRRTLVERAGGLRSGLEGAQDYDLLLRCSRLTSPALIAHIPKVLYHWRVSDSSTALDSDRKAYARRAGRRALQDYFSLDDTPVHVACDAADNFFRVTFEPTAHRPLVSIIVPTRDQASLLAKCVDGILNRTKYRNFEIVIVDNDSAEPQTLEYLRDIGHLPQVRVIRFAEPFNFSRICNTAARCAQGELLGFLNDDVDVINSDWLDEMVMLAERPDVGCVGAKLHYADGTIQHAGIVLGIGGYAVHAHRCYPEHSGGYQNRLKVRQNVSAVTGACLVMRKSLFDEVGGMDERLAVACNDVDLCLKVSGAGYNNIFTPYARLYHLESRTRGYEDTSRKQARLREEKGYLQRKWQERIIVDPFYNPNLTQSREDFSIRL